MLRNKRRKRNNQRWEVSSPISLLVCHCLTLLAVSSVMYSFGVGGFRYYDPRLLKIFRWGILLSLAGIVLGISGVWRPSSLRWHAPASTVGTLMFWIMAVSME